jgi:hypothetical protein
MTQAKLLEVKKHRGISRNREFAEAVGLSSHDEIVTLRFVENVSWGKPARLIQIDRKVAEQLTRLLNDELDDAKWAY